MRKTLSGFTALQIEVSVRIRSGATPEEVAAELVQLAGMLTTPVWARHSGPGVLTAHPGDTPEDVLASARAE